jgi:hypothetical protein
LRVFPLLPCKRAKIAAEPLSGGHFKSESFRLGVNPVAFTALRAIYPFIGTVDESYLGPALLVSAPNRFH